MTAGPTTDLSTVYDAELDELSRRLAAVRSLPGLPDPPDYESVRSQVQRVVEVVPPAAVDPQTIHVFDTFITQSVDAAFATWRKRVHQTHGSIIGELDSLAADAAKLETRTAGSDASHQAESQRRASVVRSVISDAFDPDPPLFGAQTNANAGAGQATKFDVTDPQNANPAVVTAHHWTSLLYVAVLLVAVGIDIATFYQVFALVVFNVPDWVVWLGVVGFTATALSLAHAIGALARRRSLAHRSVVGSAGAWLCFGVWIFVGLTAFLVRGLASPPAGGSQSEIVVDGSTQSTDTGPLSWLPALLFLALYLATGAVAATGAYQRHNPAARRYKAAVAAHAEAKHAETAVSGAAARAHGLTLATQQERQRRLDEMAEVQKVAAAIGAAVTQWAQLWLVALKADPTFTAQAIGTT